MFEDFEKVTQNEKQKKTAGGAPGSTGCGNLFGDLGGKDGDDPPMDEKEMKQFEEQFMGMFQNLAKQIDDLEDEDGDDGEDGMPDEA